MNKDKNKNDNYDGNLFSKVPIIAIIFPPVGILMLLKYALKKISGSRKEIG